MVTRTIFVLKQPKRIVEGNYNFELDQSHVSSLLYNLLTYLLRRLLKKKFNSIDTPDAWEKRSARGNRARV